ncbi:hypothetical protein J7W08_10325 [Methanococcoides orientis]|uniref:hypothetical protein n=1 Tax=Methanococcoides orientis TaxID=2822137 RepID=UPI001E55FB5B|nr:hypothetical protein [Methanococcoides orientis]UGV40450.1 hypothetical protein J7W08_10325 [Methanococcoides orientis]
MSGGTSKEDVRGRIESFDQSVRSLEKRLRAVERRLSVEVPAEDVAGTVFETQQPPVSGDVRSAIESIDKLKVEVEELRSLVEGSLRVDIDKLSDKLESSLASQDEKLMRIEDRNRITIGSIKMPVELSGIMGAALLLLTGGLIFAGRWDILRSPYFSLGLGLALAVAVLVKFYVVNRKAD